MGCGGCRTPRPCWLPQVSQSSALSSPAPVSLLTFSRLCWLLAANRHLASNTFTSIMSSRSRSLLLRSAPFPSILSLSSSCDLGCKRQTACLTFSFTVLSHTHSLLLSVPPRTPREGLYLARGIKISSCIVEAQKRSSGQLTWTLCATCNPHLLHTNLRTMCLQQCETQITHLWFVCCHLI